MSKYILYFIFFIFGIIVCVFASNYMLIYDFIGGDPVLKFLAKQVGWFVPVAVSIWLLFYKIKLERSERSKVAMMDAIFRLGSHYNASVNFLCGNLNMWFGSGSIVVSKFSHGGEVREKICRENLYGISGFDVNLLQEVFDLEDRLLWIYSIMTDINTMIDLGNGSSGKKKNDVFSEIIDNAKSALEYSIKYSEDFKEVSRKIVKQLNESGQHISFNENNIDSVVVEAKSTKKVMDKIFANIKGDNEDMGNLPIVCEDGLVKLVHGDNVVVKVGIIGLANGGLEEFVGTAMRLYGPVMGQRIRIYLLEHFFTKMKIVLLNYRQTTGGSAEGEDQQGPPLDTPTPSL